MVLNVMTPGQREEFEKTHECQFAISAQGVGRFRVSCFYQRNCVGMVLRRIESKIPTTEEVNLRSEEHTSELQSLMRISYAVFCLKKKTKINVDHTTYNDNTIYNLFSTISTS